MLMRLASKLVPTWVWAAGLGIALVGGAGWWVLTERERLTAERDEAQREVATLADSRDRWYARAMDTIDQLGDQRRRAQEAEAALTALQARLAQQTEAHRRLVERIDQAGPGEDGDVAPVLRDTLEALR